MQISRLCKIDSKDEEYFDSLWLPKVFIGCDKTSACTVFKLCSSLHAGMENLLLACGVLAVMAGVFWILHTCINELNQTEYCSVCGFYDPHLDNDMDNDTENRKGRGQKRRRKDSQCRNCTKRRKATAEPPCRMRRCNSHTRIHTSFVEHVCSDPQRSPQFPSACGCVPMRCTSDLCRTPTTCSQPTTKPSLRRKSLHQTGGAEAGAGADPLRHLAQGCP